MLQINSFRNRLLVLFTGSSFVLGLGITLYIGQMASMQMTKASGQSLYLSAKNISNLFANSLTEREREMVLLSQSPFFTETDFNNPQLQLKLKQVKESYKYYAWLGIATPDGKVAVDANNLLTNADVSSRPWFIGGSHHAYLGDVHEAVLLAKKLKAMNPKEPMRFIDFSTPIFDKNNQLKGILAAHADWSWASYALESTLPEDAAQQGIEVFILNKKGEILYPYSSVGTVKAPVSKGHNKAFFLDNWSSQQEYLTTNVPIISETQMSLGWHVMIRQPVSIALADVRSLQQHIAILGLFISLLMLWITYKLANKFSKPIENLADTAHAVERGEEDVNFEQDTDIIEIKGLSQSLKSMTDTLLQQKQQLIEINSTLEQKVKERTQALEEANAELKKLARHDVLTGLYNRRAFNDQINYLFAQFQRTKQTYTILLFDIDHFKSVNDSYGHDTGDQVLQQVAKHLLSLVRKTDFVARFGGEEFVIILPATELSQAIKLAEKIRMGIANADILTARPITVSIGVDEVKALDEDEYTVIRRADQALYAAKVHGRNRVEIIN